MTLPFLTRDVFDALIVIVIIIGLVAAAFRLRADFTRPLPPDPDEPIYDDDATEPNRPDQPPGA